MEGFLTLNDLLSSVGLTVELHFIQKSVNLFVSGNFT